MEPATALRVLSNERLAALAARGDEGAFAVLYERHRGALYRYCHGILRQDDDAQDAVQATMTRALTGLAGREPGASWNAWLFRIARNESLDQLRRRRSFEPLVDAHASHDASPHERAEHRERLRAVLRDLGELPARQRDALVMRALGGLASAEIGAALSLSPAAARQAVFEARESLQEDAAGREMACSAVRQTIAGGDARRLRARPLRAHLRSCATCRSFRAEQRNGLRGRLAALVPLSWWLPGWGSGAGETATSIAGGSVAAKALLAALATTVTVGAAHRGLVPFARPEATGPTPHAAHRMRALAAAPPAASPPAASVAARSATAPARAPRRHAAGWPPARSAPRHDRAPAAAPPSRRRGHATAPAPAASPPLPAPAPAPAPAAFPGPAPLAAPEQAAAPAPPDAAAPAPASSPPPAAASPPKAPPVGPAAPSSRPAKPASPAPADPPAAQPAAAEEPSPAAPGARPNDKVPPGKAARPGAKVPPGQAKRASASDSA